MKMIKISLIFLSLMMGCVKAGGDVSINSILLYLMGQKRVQASQDAKEPEIKSVLTKEIKEALKRQIAEDLLASKEQRYKVIEQILLNREMNFYSRKRLEYLVESFKDYKGKLKCQNWCRTKFISYSGGCPWNYEKVSVIDPIYLNKILKLAININDKDLISYIYKIYTRRGIRHTDMFKIHIDFRFDHNKGYLDKPKPQDLDMLHETLETHKDPVGMARFLLSFRDFAYRKEYVHKTCQNAQGTKYENYCKHLMKDMNIEIAQVKEQEIKEMVRKIEL